MGKTAKEYKSFLCIRENRHRIFTNPFTNGEEMWYNNSVAGEKMNDE